MLAAFSVERAWSSSYQFQCCNCCSVREASAEFRLGTRTDDFEWRFRDNSVDGVLGVIDPLISYFDEEAGDIATFLNGTPVACVINKLLGFNNNYKSHWRKMRMVNLGFEGKIDTNCCVYARGTANYGWIADGTYQPRGYYEGNGELFENLLSDFGLAPSADKKVRGSVWDVSGGIGYNFRLACDTFEFAPLVGWSYHNVHFRTDRYRNFTELFGQLNEVLEQADLGDLGIVAFTSESRARYNSYWTGPWIGFDTVYNWDCRLSLVCSFQYHYARQNGKGNVRSYDQYFQSEEVDFHFDDFAVGSSADDYGRLAFDSDAHFNTRVNLRGYFIGGGINYNLNDCYYAGFHVDYWNMRKVQEGHVRVETDAHEFTAGFSSTSDFRDDQLSERDICLNYMKWTSLRFNLVVGVNY